MLHNLKKKEEFLQDKLDYMRWIKQSLQHEARCLAIEKKEEASEWKKLAYGFMKDLKDKIKKHG